MAGQQVIDEIADDRVRLVAEFCDDTANQDAGAAVPFEIDNAVRFPGAMNFRPAMRAACSKVFGRHELEFLFELRIAHDLVPQRTAARGYDLNHSLHSLGLILKGPKHHVSVNQSFSRMPEGARQRPDNPEPELLPKMNGGFIG